MAVQLIIDSASDLTAEEAKALGVKLIPIPINFGKQEYLSGVNITQEEFYNKLASCKELPTTSQPAPYEFEKAFQEVKDAGDEAVVLCISSALSGTYQSARAIAQDYSDCVWVVDTLSVTIGQRLLLDYALQLRGKGYNAQRLAEEIENAKTRLTVYGIVNTLDYLVKGGRLSKAAGAAGTLLGIRPVLTVRDGVLQVISKARGVKAAHAALNKLVEETPQDPNMPAMIAHTGTDDADLTAFLETADLKWSMVPRGIVGSTVGTHTGPHLICLGYFKP